MDEPKNNWIILCVAVQRADANYNFDISSTLCTELFFFRFQKEEEWEISCKNVPLMHHTFSDSKNSNNSSLYIIFNVKSPKEKYHFVSLFIVVNVSITF